LLPKSFITPFLKPAPDPTFTPAIGDVLIVDTSVGNYSTITTRDWHIFSTTNHSTLLTGYQSERSREYPVANGITKATIPGRDDPILLIINYATVVDDDSEMESLHIPFQSMRHGVKFDMTPPIYGGTGSMSINDDIMPLNFDGEKRFLSISKPTKDDYDLYDCYKLSSALHTPVIHPRHCSKKTMHEDIPMIEWSRRLAMAPEDIVSKTLQHTTQCYLNVDRENRSNMREHYQSCFPGLRLPRQKEGVATDTYFPSVKTSRGHTCSQMFVGLASDRWYTQPLKTESHNGQAL